MQTMSRQKRANSWSAPTSDDEAHRRAAGRAHFNALRREAAERRRLEIARRLVAAGGMTRGCQRRLAAQFGVSESTISRDIVTLMRSGGATRCPCCLALWPGEPDELGE